MQRCHFNPRAPCGARHKDRPLFCPIRFISIHAPHAGRDVNQTKWRDNVADFNPRAPCGARPGRLQHHPFRKRFQSTRPMRGATLEVEVESSNESLYFNPRAPCGARLLVLDSLFANVSISIHAPHAGRDAISASWPLGSLIFQSTRPMRGATMCNGECRECEYISIHAPHAGRDPRW